MLALLDSMLASDVVHVNFNGVETVGITEGIAEGGSLGPLAFPVYIDSLAEALHRAGCGVGLGVRIPEPWTRHHWVGTGTPDADVTANLLSALRQGGPLPAVADLVADACLEASALAALDLAAPRRLAAILHADDPVLLTSTRGAAQRSLQVYDDWAHAWKASPRTNSSKHAVVVH